MGKIIHCGESKKFLYEGIEGYGFCGKKDNEVCYCGDKCHIRHGKPWKLNWNVYLSNTLNCSESGEPIKVERIE